MASTTHPLDEDYSATRQRSRRAHEEFMCLGILKNIIEKRGIDFVTVDDLRCLQEALVSSLQHRHDRPSTPVPGQTSTSTGTGNSGSGGASQFHDIISSLPWVLRKELVDFFHSDPIDDNPYVERFLRRIVNGNVPVVGTGGSQFIDLQSGRFRVLRGAEVRVRAAQAGTR
ncbi:hypothetical protein PRK78_006719 [Emydomyces testavorans]|uniref:Uncharacterized protein n=1 Tax=Emydomyces testavorans TaxID=2070801 RepID=A0AAF0INY2_9EURO|nr:hypothetical protein PRK78_006719 [Emydomyces testavorans]